jgi:PAS domain S-box-containing protein
MPQAPLDPILSRQLRRLGIPESDPPAGAQWDALLERVSRTYEESRQSRYLVERSLSIVSTEMQELYAQLERSANQRLERFFERAPDLFCLAGFDGHLTMVNPAWERVLGVPADELLAGPFIELVHPDDRAATGAILDQLSQGRAVVAFENRFRHASGRWVPLRWTAIADLDTGVIYASGRDVTWESEARDLSGKIVEASPSGMILVDSQGVVALANGQAERLFGYGSGELVGLSVEVLVPPGVRSRHEQLRLEFAQAPHDWLMAPGRDLLGISRTGEPVPVEVALNRVTIAGSAYVLAAIADISMRKEVEEELRRARDEALTLARVKADFLANMSHEIRTPLNAIIGLAGLLVDGDLDAEQREHALTIRQAGDTLLTVINDILDFSKIEAGRLALEEVVFEPRETMTEALQIVGGAARAKGLDVSVAFDPTVPDLVRGDPGRVRQVLLNLLSNAVKFTPVGAIHVEVTHSEPTMSYRVADTGGGIAEESLSSLFDAFTQADTSMTRRFGGSGLGLAISRRIVELMGGSISVTSVPHQGSEFSFEIPLPAVQGMPPEDSGDLMAERASQRAGESGPASTAPGLPRMPAGSELDPAGVPDASPDRLRILLVEDNAVNQKVALAMLRRLGHEADAVGDGFEALASLAQIPYDLVLMDCQMPDMDGFAATREWRRIEPGGSRLPIVALTASAMEGDRERCLAAGMDGYITKPVTSRHLAEAIERYRVAQGPTQD